MVAHKINELDNFICGWYLKDDSICDDLIHHHGKFPNKRGVTSGSVGKKIDENIKKSYDVELTNEHLGKRYLEQLHFCVEEYKNKYKYCDYYAPWKMAQYPNIQKYEPNGAFYAWHTERSCAVAPNCDRHLVFMTYLNDVEDAGETEFYHQKIKVRPEKGLTIIWPADWTFTHRGLPSPSQEKFIVTGWYNYY